MQKKIFVAVWIAVIVALLGVLAFTSFAPPVVDASTVIGYQTVTLEDGTDVYTTTTYTLGYLAGSFGEVVLQIHSDISGTETMTVTPQFSSEGVGCRAITNWADATIAGVVNTLGAQTVTVSTLNTNTLTTTVGTAASAAVYSVVDVVVTLAGDDSTLLRFNSLGKCMRVKMESATTFTPTMYAWMVNTQ
jgi:hypothetical protein